MSSSFGSVGLGRKSKQNVNSSSLARRRRLAVESLETRHLLSGVELLSASVQAYPLVTYDSVAAASDGGISLQAITSPAAANYPYLSDVNTGAQPAPAPGAPPIGQELYPRLNMTQASVANIEVASKYNTVAYDGTRLNQAAQLKTAYPDSVVLRYFIPTSFQKVHATDGKFLPFTTTGPATDGKGAVFAGHWQYLAGATTTQAISATAKTIGVTDASRFKVGQYVVIYDGPAGSFRNAEHAKVSGINVAGHTITLAARAYKSVAVAHPAGAIVAQHDLGVGGSGTAVPAEDWAYNISSDAPRDSNGKQFNTVNATWIANNLSVDINGNPIGDFKFDGLIFDGEIGQYLTNPLIDTNNDLIGDAGVTPAGVNVRGQGLETFYSTVRQLLPPRAILVGGTGLVRGFSSLNGVQNEGYPHVSTSYVSPADYKLFDQKLDHYTYHVHEGVVGPQYNETINKTPTKVYPVLQNGGTAPTSNAPFRFSFGFSLLEDGSYGQDRGGIDAWWDEYSVDVTPGSLTFGKAIPDNPVDETNVRAHLGWLGSPLGPRQRLYEATTFAATNTRVTNGGFETGFVGWTGSNVNLSSGTVAANVFAGTKSLHISPQNAFSSSVAGAAAVGPAISVVAGQTYTVAFAAKSSALREISVNLRNTTQAVFVSPEWQRHVLTFVADKTGNFNLSFFVGQFSSDVYIDEVYVFNGSANVFQRDFTNGTVFVNATPVAQTIQLSAVYQRIKGTQDAAINNGAVVSGSITIAPYDSAILIRQGASSVVPPAPAALTAVALSSTQVKLVWQDLSGNEGGFKIERKAGAGAYVSVTQVGAGVESFSDTGLTAGVTYSYRVRATNGVGDSLYSNIATLTTPSVAAPAAPTVFVATIKSPTQVLLTWVNVANNATGYQIERSTGTPNAFAQIVQVASNFTSYNDKTARPGTLYYYRIRAINAAGNSLYAPITFVTTPLV